MKSTLKNMIVVLFAITLVASSAVGAVYQLTKEPIAIAKQTKLDDAIKAVLPSDFDTLDEKQEVDVDGVKVPVYAALKDGEVVAYAVESFSKAGFGGEVKVLVGFKADGSINSTTVVSHGETPGLGDKMDKSKSDFATQFDGKNPASDNLKVTKDGGSIDAITAATISSRAYVNAVENAYKAYQMVAGK